MVAAYTTFATLGIHSAPYGITAEASLARGDALAVGVEGLVLVAGDLPRLVLLRDERVPGVAVLVARDDLVAGLEQIIMHPQAQRLNGRFGCAKGSEQDHFRFR